MDLEEKQKTLSKADIVNKFKEISTKKLDESSREYELKVVGIVKDYKGDDREFINNLEAILLENLQDSSEIAYMAFYCIATYHRRRKNITYYKDLLDKYRKEFGKYKSLQFLELMFDKLEGKKHFEQILTQANNLCQQMPDNVGVVHCFSETVAEVCERPNQHIDERMLQWLELAIDRIKKVIENDCNYAKFYCTTGRLLAIKAMTTNDEEKRQDAYYHAVEYIKQAIDLEESMTSDYALRIGNYQHYINMIQLDFYKDSLDKQWSSTQEKLDKKINSINVQNLEFLGFFVALVSFTLGSISFIKENSFETCATLILVLMGALLVAFSGLGFILHGFENKVKPNLAVMGIGALIIVGSLWYGSYI